MITGMTAPLEAVGAALVDAQAALLRCDPAATRDSERRTEVHAALVTLARTSYDALASWETQGQSAPPAPTTSSRVAAWRGQLDEIRVQAALAEMEVRDTSQEVLAAVEDNVSAVEKVLVAAGRDIGTAVTTFRHELRRVVHT